ncbi:MAG: dockerin type I domain-containing protein [Planctomycetota bacterium]
MAADMTNPVEPLDVNADDKISPLDALNVINYLGRAEGEQVSNAEVYPDTNADQIVSPRDALVIMNHLAAGEEVSEDETDPIPVIRKFEVRGEDVITVDFEGDNVQATVEVTEDGVVRFTGAGQQFDLTTGIPKILKLRVDGHFNSFVARGIQVEDDMIVDVDGNRNQFALLNSSVGDDLIYIGAEGVDEVLIQDSVIADMMKFDGNKSDDALGVINTSIGDDFLFYGDKGVDLLYAENVDVGDDAVVRMGRGDDAIAVQDVRIHDVADIQGDSGSDAIAADLEGLIARRVNVREFEANPDFSEVEPIVDSLLPMI